MECLDNSEIRIKRDGDDRVAAALHHVDGVIYWTSHALAELPNDLIGAEDLERFGIALDGVQVASIA